MSRSDRDAAAVRFPPPFLFLISIGLGWLVNRDLHSRSIPIIDGTLRWLLCAVFVAAGLALALAALGLFRRTGQAPEPWTSTPSIVTDGVYRYTRNPMYVAMALVQIGVGFGLDNPWIVNFTVFSLLAVYYVAVRPEETYLEQKFGDEYLRYKARVRRWL